MGQPVPDQKKKPSAIGQLDAQLLFETAPLAMFIVNRDRRLLHYNRAAAAMAGRVKKSGLGLRGGEFFNCVTAFADPKGCGFSKACETCTIRNTVLDTFQSGHEHRSVEASIPVKVEGGVQRTWVLISTAVVSFGKEEGVLICMKDITERKRAEKALSEKNDELVLEGKLANLFLTSSDEEVFAGVLDLLRSEFDCGHGYFGYIDQEGDLICPSMTAPFMAPFCLPVSSMAFPKDQIDGPRRNKSAPRQKPRLELPKDHPSLYNSLLAPIVINNELVGQIVLANKPSDFSQEDEEKLTSIAAFLAPIFKIYLEKENVKKQLLLKAEKLKERNVALKVLLENRDEEKRQQAEKLAQNFDRLVFPYFAKLESCNDRQDRLTLLEIIASNANDCLSSETPSIHRSYGDLTPMEVQVADLIKSGKTSKEIAVLLNISPRSVYFHRNNLRRKLNLKKTNTNLRTFLATRF